MHIDYRIPILNKIVFISKFHDEITLGFGQSSLIFGKWFVYLEQPR